MATTQEELNSFTLFVQRNEGSNLRLAELFDRWKLENPSRDDYAENVAAVNASIQDFLNGERGTPAGEHSQQLRDAFGIGSRH